MNYLLELPLSLGIHGTYKGYRYLVFALELALSDENQLLYVTKNLYPSVARRYHTTPSCVDRDLRTVISLEIKSVPGLKNMVFGGEGLFNTVVTGPGRVWLQTMPVSNVAELILKFMPPKS